MKVNIINGTKLNKITREIKTIRKMSKKGVIIPPVAKIFMSWDIAETVKTPYYRITKW